MPVTATNGVLSHDVPIEPSSTFDTSLFRSYLLALLPPVIGASPAELQSLFDDEFEDRVSRFAAEGGGVIYVVKVKEESEG
jgi:dynein heavy chain 1